MCTVAQQGILCGAEATYWYEWVGVVYENAPVPAPVFRCDNHRIQVDQYAEYLIS